MNTETNDMTSPNDVNPDPITGAPGAHPAGVGAGAASGGLAGAAIGAVGGPIGAAAGIAIGAVAGGLAGKSAAEYVDPTAEDAYWRDNYRNRPYVTSDDDYDRLAPAYRTGYEGRGRYADQDFEAAEPQLRSDYEAQVGGEGLSWERAKDAARDAWERVEQYFSSDKDRNNR